jgi:hypothetical protein
MTLPRHAGPARTKQRGRNVVSAGIFDEDKGYWDKRSQAGVEKGIGYST